MISSVYLRPYRMSSSLLLDSVKISSNEVTVMLKGWEGQGFCTLSLRNRHKMGCLQRLGILWLDGQSEIMNVS